MLRLFHSSRVMSLSAWQFWTLVKTTVDQDRLGSPFSAMARSMKLNLTAAPSQPSRKHGLRSLSLKLLLTTYKASRSRRFRSVDGVKTTMILQASSWQTTKAKNQRSLVWRDMLGTQSCFNRSPFKRSTSTRSPAMVKHICEALRLSTKTEALTPSIQLMVILLKPSTSKIMMS